MVWVLIPVDFFTRGIKWKIICMRSSCTWSTITMPRLHTWLPTRALGGSRDCLDPNEGAHVANPGQLDWLKDCPDPNEGARLLLTQASWLQDHVVHCL